MLLRALISEWDWKYETFRARYESHAQQLADAEGRPDLGNLSVSEATFERWLLGRVTPQPDARRVLAHMFGRSVQDLLGPAPTVLDGAAPGAAPPTHHASVTTSAADPAADLHERGKVAAMAAQRALRWAVATESSQLGGETLEHLSDEVRRLAAAYPRVALGTILSDLVEVQDLVFRLLESTRMKPNQARDLYVLAAMTSGMLSKAAHDLGDPQSAMRQARAAFVCADQADHPPMRAWVRGLQSLIAYWAGRPGDAARYAVSGAQAVPGDDTAGTVAVWLAALEARAHALLGDSGGVREATAAADRAAERTVPDDLDAIGGLFTFPRPRHLYYAAEAEVMSPGAGPEVIRHAEDAVRAYDEAVESEWAFGDHAGARTNLTIARLVTGDVEGAAEAMRPVLDLPVDQHIGGVVLSAQRVHGVLRQSPVRTGLTGRDMLAEIEMFTSLPSRGPFSLPR